MSLCRVFSAIHLPAASCAIPFFFTPLRVPASPSSTSGACDLLVDGCITDCTPLAGLSVGGGGGWDPKRTLVLAVHDAAGLESPDFQVGGVI